MLMVASGRSPDIACICFQTLTNVAMVTASNSVQMFLDPIPVRATLVSPSMRMEDLAKVCDVWITWTQ